MSMRILVTGGCGFIGRYIVEELLRHDYDVKVIDNLSAQGSQLPESNYVDFSHIDLRDETAIHSAFQGIDACIAVAARCSGIGYFNKHPGEMLDDNVRIISSTFEAAKKQGISRMVYVSSSCVFDNSPVYTIAEKDIQISPAPPAGYPFSKLVGEHYCRAYEQQYGLTYTIVRPFNVYGPGEMPGKKPGDSHVIPDLSAKLLMGQHPLEIFGDGYQTRSFTHVKDIASGIVAALEHPSSKNEDFNFGHPLEISILELAHKLWNISGMVQPFQVKTVNSFEHDVPRRGIDITKAKMMLGWEPKIDLEQGLAEYFEWLKNKMALGVAFL